ncbi:ribonuclease E/G, partial [Paracidovorax avenae]
ICPERAEGEAPRNGRGPRDAEGREGRPARERDRENGRDASVRAEGDYAPRNGREGREGGRGRERREAGDAPRQQPLGTDAGMAAAQDVGIEGQSAAPQERGERVPRNGERRERRERGGDRRPRGEEGQAEFVDTSPMASLPDLDLTGSEAGGPAADSASGEEPRRERRSRDRYGRDRRERAPREGAEAESAPVDESTTAQAVQDVAGEGAAQEAPRRSYFSQGGSASAPIAATVASEAAPHGEAPAEPAQALASVPEVAPAPAVATAVAPAPAPAPVTTPAPAPAPAAAAAVPGLPRVQAFQLPVDELNRIAESSGLQWVNSDAEKIAAAQAVIAAEPRPVHVPRERPPAVVLDEGPLVLVETRRDLRDLKLPFEQQPSSVA